MNIDPVNGASLDLRSGTDQCLALAWFSVDVGRWPSKYWRRILAVTGAAGKRYHVPYWQEGAVMPNTKLELTQDEAERVVSFCGYGNPAAPVWFVGIEEGLGDANSEDARRNLKARARFDATMDLHQAHLLLEEDKRPIDIEKKEKFTPVWEYMGKIMRARGGQKDWDDLVSARQYIRNRLGRADGETFLTELSPIPSSKTTDKSWRKSLLGFDPDLDVKIDRRRGVLKSFLGDKTQLVICYGKRANQFAELFGIKWTSTTTGEPSARVAVSIDGRFLLLPFFGVGQISHELIAKVSKAGYLNR